MSSAQSSLPPLHRGNPDAKDFPQCFSWNPNDMFVNLAADQHRHPATRGLLQVDSRPGLFDTNFLTGLAARSLDEIRVRETCSSASSACRDFGVPREGRTMYVADIRRRKSPSSSRI
jgi:hypothetical protein